QRKVTRRDYDGRGLCYCDGGPLLLESLRESLIPLLHVTCHRRLDSIQSIPKVLHGNTIRLDISHQRDEPRLSANTFYISPRVACGLTGYLVNINIFG